MWNCPNCGEQIPASVDRCTFCDFPKSIHFDNYCINPKCTEYNVQLDNDSKICKVCGKLTKIGKIIKDQS